MRRFMIAASAAALLIPAALAQEGKNTSIPKLAASNFGWQTNLEDWQDPPPGNGHGPMRNDPAYPFVNTAGGEAPENDFAKSRDPTSASVNGTQPTVRIANSKDPILKPWAAA